MFSKSKIQSTNIPANPFGFTLIELLVVISIMVLLATVLIANYNKQKGVRNLKIAQNELATNARKTQSFILSSRDAAATNGTLSPAKYYVLKIDKNATQYTVQNINKSYVSNDTIETIVLPQGIIISNVQFLTSGGVINGGSATPPSWLQLAYAAPYGQLYVYSSIDTCTGAATLSVVVQNPGCMLTLSNRNAVITLSDQKSGQTKTVTMYGVSGKVEAGP